MRTLPPILVDISIQERINTRKSSNDTTDELKERNPNTPDINIHIGLLGIGGGYGYNWVLGKKWLLHFSMLPTFVIYNFSLRYFAGATLTMSNSFFDNDVTVNQNKWHASERHNPML